MKEILPLTSLRFLAALYVFLFHIHLRWPLDDKGAPIAKFISLGAVGMSIFFILSGFVLAYRYGGEESVPIKKYAFERFSRIYPVYVVAALVTIPWLFSSLPQDASAMKQAVQAAFIILADMLLIQAWMPQLFSYWNNGGSWSISVEMFFYAMFPYVLLQLRTMESASIKRMMWVLWIASALPGLSWALFPKSFDMTVFYSVPLFRLSEFLIGVCAGLLFLRGRRPADASRSFMLISAALVFYLTFGPHGVKGYVVHNLFTVPMIAYLIYSAASLQSGLVYRIMTCKPMVYMGHISYSFYSFQALVVMSLIAYKTTWEESLPILGNSWGVTAAAFLVLTAISALSYHVLELKFRKKIHTYFPAKSRVFSKLPLVEPK